jgi:ribosomal protein L21E
MDANDDYSSFIILNSSFKKGYAMKFKQGDYVRVVEREQTAADVKNGMFYPYFCGLAGTIERIYDDAVCVKVEPDTMPDGARKRHKDIQESIKQKWLNGLSGEARNRLTAEEKRFELSYTILVMADDVEKADRPQMKPADQKSAAHATDLQPERPVTSNDLSEAELKHLREREEALKDS